MFNIETHGDFQRLFCKTANFNYWLLGYFGGGAVNVQDMEIVAKQFAEKNGVPYESVRLDTITSSRRYKNFRYVFSVHKGQVPETNSSVMNDVYNHITD